ncbi:CatA-like O-acetyltransferase [uncultured Faecalibaculum sp.]|uniref:CatA-like O-acetyltransferase n=1 Tax=uncultured Faecalibaculum sp. TaxID=1729681 RepID=UPI0025D532FF|nr:CatA-like O-acetyltransferase [uncultured Faecalibaculum sp.]
MPEFRLPSNTSRQQAFELWKHSFMPMVTLTKTFDVSSLAEQPHFNARFVWAIARAASRIPEFYLLPGTEGFLLYDRLAVNVIVKTETGGICDCLIPWNPDIRMFLEHYRQLTEQAARTGICPEIENAGEYMVIGTSTLIATTLDSAVNACSPWPNPYLIWGKLPPNGQLPVSFQFHHAQMDGYEAAMFLETLQQTVAAL